MLPGNAIGEVVQLSQRSILIKDFRAEESAEAIILGLASDNLPS